MVFEICISVITFILVVLIIYIILTLKAFQKTLERLNDVIVLLEPKIEIAMGESIRLLHNSNELTQLTHHHLNAFNPLLKSVSSIGETLEKSTHSLNSEKITSLENNHKTSRGEQLEELIELVARGIRFWQLIKKKETK